jgi:hypothetical protein
MKSEPTKNVLNASFSELSAYSRQGSQLSRRTEPRRRASGPAVMTVVGPAQSSSCMVTVLDVSVSGVGVSSPVYVEPGSTVSLAMSSVTLEADVRWCRRQPEEESFRVGLLIRQMIPS